MWNDRVWDGAFVARSLRIGLLLLILSVACAGGQTPRVDLPPGSIIRGTITDSTTGRPISGLYIWPFRRAYGAVTDSNGQFEFPDQFGINTFIVRACNDSNLTTVWADFSKSERVETRDTIPMPPFPCPQRTRPPWSVDASDSTMFTGIYTYSWEGGGWFTECGGKTHDMDLAAPILARLREYMKEEGQQTFLRMRGRVVDDHLRIFFPGPLLLAGSLIEVRPTRSNDCK